MASLSSILNRNLATYQVAEKNIEQGQVFFYQAGNSDDSDYQAGALRCWQSPGNGCVTVEVWGASGSAPKLRCCAGQIPGNPGAYAKKSFAVDASSTVCMDLGQSCRNDTCCFKGTSESTCVCWVGSSGNGEICAGGGRGGYGICADGGSIYCCFIAAGFPGQVLKNIGGAYASDTNDGCGIVCNYVSGEIAQACGGDINLDGGWSCTTFSHCRVCCGCYFHHHVRIAPGLYSKCGSVVTFNMECGDGYANRLNGTGIHQLLASINSLSRAPLTGMPWAACWAGHRACGCYQTTLCSPYTPHGVPGAPTVGQTDHHSYGYRGGHGAVRISFVGA